MSGILELIPLPPPITITILIILGAYPGYKVARSTVELFELGLKVTTGLIRDPLDRRNTAICALLRLGWYVARKASSFELELTDLKSKLAKLTNTLDSQSVDGIEDVSCLLIAATSFSQTKKDKVKVEQKITRITKQHQLYSEALIGINALSSELSSPTSADENYAIANDTKTISFILDHVVTFEKSDKAASILLEKMLNERIISKTAIIRSPFKGHNMTELMSELRTTPDMQEGF